MARRTVRIPNSVGEACVERIFRIPNSTRFSHSDLDVIPTEPVAWHLRDWLSDHLDIDQSHKEFIYCQLLRSLTLCNVTYWLQVLFSAGIATLGLVLNSPAVIIGAMLISPLMEPILATGLAFAAGDLILGARALLSVSLSCLGAIAFAMLLIAWIPFKEQTPEIMARIRPNVLDLVIALFSGALGSLALCVKERGGVTAIPGVAIAVALMPPLCVVGYGLGVSLSLDPVTGREIARGGGLLFLTNLAAITFTAMVVFLAVHIDTPPLQEKIRQWHRQNRESHWIQTVLDRLPVSQKLQVIGSLPSRFIVSFIPILLLLIPLNQAFGRLQQEVIAQDRQNQLTQTATQLWREQDAKFNAEQPRSYIRELTVQEQGDLLILRLTVFTQKVYTEAEKQAFLKQLADRLGRSPNSISFRLTQILTASSVTKLIELERQAKPQPSPPPPPTIAETQAAFVDRVDELLTPILLPEPAQFLRYQLTTSPDQPAQLQLFYLSQREIDPDGQSLLSAAFKSRLELADLEIALVHVPTSPGVLTFDLDQDELQPASLALLDRVGSTLKQHPNLQLDLSVQSEAAEPANIAQTRVQAIRDRLQTQWRIPADRIKFRSNQVVERGQQPTLDLKIRAGSPESFDR